MKQDEQNPMKTEMKQYQGAIGGRKEVHDWTMSLNRQNRSGSEARVEEKMTDQCDSYRGTQLSGGRDCSRKDSVARKHGTSLLMALTFSANMSVERDA